MQNETWFLFLDALISYQHKQILIIYFLCVIFEVYPVIFEITIQYEGIPRMHQGPLTLNFQNFKIGTTYI